ncbi:XRE family transcriptional regulator [Micrococcoides hystricis]|uniref:XRE family transcriptional regulator n=1 Tax=Micrococcoides hystricis TaxID=1572761 RepID=A0ABV6PBE1_9MICC
MEKKLILTSDLARAARALTKVSREIIGKAAGLTEQEVQFFEHGRIDLTPGQREALKAALEEYGALFIPEDGRVGYGVRRRLTRDRYMKLNAWEGEGGA